MKKIIGILSLGAFVLATFFNISVVQVSSSNINLANLLTTASANEEAVSKGYQTKTTTTTSTTSTYQNNYGEWCGQTSTTVTVDCEGTGMTACTPSETTSYEKDC